MDALDFSVGLGAVLVALFNTLVDRHVFQTDNGIVAVPWFVALAVFLGGWAFARRYQLRKGQWYWLVAALCGVFLVACHVSEIIGQVVGASDDLRLSGGLYMLRVSLATYATVIYGGLRPRKAW